MTLDAGELSQLRSEFHLDLANTWRGLGVAPSSLSAGPMSAREAIAAKRVDALFDRMIRNEESIVNIKYPVTRALRKRFISEDALDAVLAKARLIRAVADSLHARADTMSRKGRLAPPP